MIDLSIIMPGIRKQNWRLLYDSVVESIGAYGYELIIVGPGECPSELLELEKFQFVSDRGCPSRAAQIGASYAAGQYMTWASDDGVYLPNGLRRCIDLLKGKTSRDGVVIRYSEGGNSPNIMHWHARTHRDLQLPGVLDSYAIAPLGMYYLKNFIDLGGWDCKYEHLNLSTHDFAFRVQNNGGHLYLSPDEVFRCAWSNAEGDAVEYFPVDQAYWKNDYPLFKKDYEKDQSSRTIIDFDNWENVPSVWQRRHGKKNIILAPIVVTFRLMKKKFEKWVKKYRKYFLWRINKLFSRI